VSALWRSVTRASRRDRRVSGETATLVECVLLPFVGMNDNNKPREQGEDQQAGGTLQTLRCLQGRGRCEAEQQLVRRVRCFLRAVGSSWAQIAAFYQ
jgi:hypothetical protein